MMRYKVHTGDCLTVLKTLPDASVDAFVTDPPYELSNDGKASAYRVFTEFMFPQNAQVDSGFSSDDQLPFFIDKVLGLRGGSIHPCPPTTVPVGSVTLDSDVPCGNDDIEYTNKRAVGAPNGSLCDNLDTERAEYIGCFVFKCTNTTAIFKALDSVGACFVSGGLGIGFRLGPSSDPRHIGDLHAIDYGSHVVRLRHDALTQLVRAISGAKHAPVARFHVAARSHERLSTDSALTLALVMLAGGAHMVRADSTACSLSSVLQPRRISVVDDTTGRALSFDVIVHPLSIASSGFMGKGWDGSKVAYNVDVWAEMLRVAKPGGHLLAFGGTRTFHRLACALEDAGWEIRDTICWMYGCLSDDTEILVDGEWVHHSKATQGRFTLCYDMASGGFVWQAIEERYVYEYNDTAYRIESDGTDQVVSRNHRCIVNRGDHWKFVVAEDAAREQEVYVPVVEDVCGLLDAVRVPDTAPSTTNHHVRGVRVLGSQFTTACLARVTAFHLRGVVWCVKVPTGAFVARRNGKVFVTGNSGFPKSLDVSKAADRHLGNPRNVQGTGDAVDRIALDYGGATGKAKNGLKATFVRDDDPRTDLARQWDGWGTALKPAFEPIIVARKPLVGTVAANVERYGVGALNIDGCRVGFQSDTDKQSAKPQGRATAKSGALAGGVQHDGDRAEFSAEQSALGRWPANVILDEEAGAMLDAQTGTTVSTGGKFSGKNALGQDSGWNAHANRPVEINRPTDSGGASRFFYCAKASKSERNAGVSGTNNHPTVKPISLMRYLCRLVTPPGGVVLDPFLGSGTTGCAALLEGFTIVGVEQSPEYAAIAEQRLSHYASLSQHKVQSDELTETDIL